MPTDEEDDSYYDIWPNNNSNSEKINAPSGEFIFALNEQLSDPIRQLVLKYYNTPEANKRQLPNADTVCPDANGLQILIVNILVLI